MRWQHIRFGKIGVVKFLVVGEKSEAKVTSQVWSFSILTFKSQRSSHFLHLNPQGVIKGKEARSSSGAKRHRTAQIVESSDTDDEIHAMDQGVVEELDVDGLPKLVKPRKFVDVFGKFGVTDYFNRLGWGANVSFNNDGDETVYMDAIEEWMSTLRREPGANPPATTQLIGRANGKEVVMSFTTLKKLARFDTRTTSGSPYYYPTDVVLSVEKANKEAWKVRVRELFVVPSGVDEIVESRVHRRAMMHQQELFRNQDFIYHEQIRHERDYERGHAYTVRPRPEN
ncbi:hypothetical protein L1987_58507 [Smallanthus sonchifolius]|uniref:Uncharacterized protein n=1 Tax=Smallanthus sonchifolius TaxID=185202 RepID=A0ACB9DFX0_9ASTR|nr:hypothetical protein L1987_58507 [Smallanthus sonchifolius]